MATSTGDKLRIEALEVELQDMKMGFGHLMELQQHMADHIKSLQLRFIQMQPAPPEIDLGFLNEPAVLDENGNVVDFKGA